MADWNAHDEEEEEQPDDLPDEAVYVPPDFVSTEIDANRDVPSHCRKPPRYDGAKGTGFRGKWNLTLDDRRIIRQRHLWPKIINALLTTTSLQNAAAASGIGIATLKRIIDEPDFIIEFEHARQEAIGLGVARLEGMFGRMVAVLDELACDKDQSGAIRVAAATKAIDIVTRMQMSRRQSEIIGQLQDELKRYKEGSHPDQITVTPAIRALPGGDLADGYDPADETGSEGDDQAG